MLIYCQQELKQLWSYQSLWLAPVAVGALLLLINSMMLGANGGGQDGILLFLPMLWMFVALSCVGQGLPFFQEESFFLFYSTVSRSLSSTYQIQLLLLSVFLWIGLGFLAFVTVLLFNFPWVMLGAQLLLLALVLPSLVALGHLVKSLLPNNSTGSVLLSFLLFPLYIPLLILSTLAIQSVWLGDPFLPYCALLMAIQLVLWVSIPPLLTFSIRLRL